MSTVCVVGLGKIGLPMAVRVAQSGRRVVGADIAPAVVESVNRGEPPFPGEPDLADELQRVRRSGALEATTDVSAAIERSDVVVVLVPLVVGPTKEPDFTALDAATDAIGPALQAGTLVSFETTLPVGATRTRFAPRLATLSGLTLGRDLFVCFSPERVSSGRVFRDLAQYPKLVGGVDEASAAAAVAFYEDVLVFDERPDLPRPNGVWDLGTSEAAELAKLAETTYRDINIGFANEVAMAAEAVGVDAGEVIDACNSQPFSHIHRPGIAVGGHCIPVYPHLLMASVPGFRIPAVARAVNEDMPVRAVDAVEQDLGSLQGRRVAVLGLAYRGGVKEHAFSGTFAVVREAEERGAVVTVHDPLYDDDELRALGLSPHRMGDEVDAAILQCDHAEYRELTEASVRAKVVYDGRGALHAEGFPTTILRAVGRPR